MHTIALKYAFIIFLCFTSLLTDTNFANAQSNAQSKSIEISVLSYNIWGLPISTPKMKQKKRFKQLTQSLSEGKYDILCLQETFRKRLRKRLLPQLQQQYQTYSDYNCNERMWGFFKTDCHGGLMNLAKFPITKEHFFAHNAIEEMSKIEKKGKKGILISELKTPIGKVYLINTHLYAGRKAEHEKVRMHQIKKMEHLIDSLQLREYPILLCGDLNAVHPSLSKQVEEECQVYQYLSQQMQFKGLLNKVEEKDYTYDTAKNEYADTWWYRSEGRQKLDYIMYHLPPNYQLNIKHQEVVYKNDQTFSDHYAVEAILKISRP